jgi:hypothetical protein
MIRLGMICPRPRHQAKEVLRTLVRHNRVQLPGLGQFPCAGAYAVVSNQGSVHVGDPALI